MIVTHIDVVQGGKFRKGLWERSWKTIALEIDVRQIVQLGNVNCDVAI